MLPGHRLTTEEEKYFYTKEYIPEIAGTFKGLAVICGGGKTMWEDLEEVRSLTTKFDIIAVNVAGLVIMEAKHIYSMHTAQLSAISLFRKNEYCNHIALVHAIRKDEHIDYAWRCTVGASTSGLNAVALAKLLGYNKSVLCGVPMDGSGYFYKPTFNDTFKDDCRLKEIHCVKERLKDQVKSMSGRTKEVLGYPTKEWIRS